MNKIWLVAKETYRREVKTWSYLLMILAPFLFILLSFVIGMASAGSSDDNYIGVVTANPVLKQAIKKSEDFDNYSTEAKAKKAYKDEDIDKLKDPKIKALFITNPSNPPSYSLSPETAARIVNIVKNDNPNLMIITDDVYGTFIPHFRSLMAELPHNTLCVYSFSKYFGATGWRLAVIALHEDNIYDKMIARLPEEQKAILNKRYSSLDLHPEKMKFIDRMVADSRQVALNHTAGLSLPQQMQMSLFSAFSLLDKGDYYKTKMQNIIRRRLNALWDNTGFSLVEDPLRAGYYSEIDMLVWAHKFYGDEFVAYLKKTYNPLDIVFRLANETSLVLLNGGGFAGPKWSVRVSLANLNEADYVTIGKGIKRILDEYYKQWTIDS